MKLVLFDRSHRFVARATRLDSVRSPDDHAGPLVASAFDPLLRTTREDEYGAAAAHEAETTLLQ